MGFHQKGIQNHAKLKTKLETLVHSKSTDLRLCFHTLFAIFIYQFSKTLKRSYLSLGV